MSTDFFRRWRRASRATRVAIARAAGLPTFCFVIGGTYLWFMGHPKIDGEPADHGRFAIVGWIARNPNPLIRVPVDLLLGSGFVLAGLFVLRGLETLFRLDHWTPSIEDPSKTETVLLSDASTSRPVASVSRWPDRSSSGGDVD